MAKELNPFFRPSAGDGGHLLQVLAVLVALSFSACAVGSGSERNHGEVGKPRLRLGYFPNLTHAPALLGIGTGSLEKSLGEVASVDLNSFHAGPSAVEALFADALDATYIGPGPAINAHVRSRGEAVRVISGATEGGAALVVRRSIRKASDLRGKKVASPHLGSTQDIALRNWLKKNGIRTNLQGGGEVSVTPQENAQTLETFRLGEIDGAWLPEPWVSRLVEEAGAKVLVEEGELWPGGRFPTAVLMVRAEYLEREPRVIRHLLEAHVDWVNRLNSDRAGSLQEVNTVLEEETGKPLPPAILKSAGDRLTFTTEIIPASFERLAREAKALGLLKSANLKGLFRLEASVGAASPSSTSGLNGG